MRQGATPAHQGAARLAFAPAFSKSATAIAHELPSLGLAFNNVRVVIHGMPDTATIVLDTIVDYSQNATSDLVLDLTVKVDAIGQRFDVGLDYRNGNTPLFHGSAVVQSYSPGDPAPPQVEVPIEFVGPGSSAKSVTVTPKSVTLSGTQSTTLSAVARDASGNPIDGAVIAWTSSDPNIATVPLLGGPVQALGHRGTATITASTPTGIGDNASVSVVLPPASISVVSGSGQTGKVHSALGAPAVVQVSASDGVGVAGVNVIFSAPTGGAVGATSVTTDANGRASTSLTLGTAAGPQSFAATAAGFSTGISETATAGDPAAIAIQSGGTQSDTVHKTLAPLSVRVTDQFTNPVPNVSVSWTKTSGGGSLASASSTTNADGIATNSYTLGSTPGSEGVSASIGSAGSVSFSFTAVPAAPAAIATISGGGQVGRAGSTLPDPFIVKVTDALGNPTPGVTVSWGATNGSIGASSVTGADGTSSNTMTLGTRVGAASATASAGGHTVTFAATVQAGAVAKLSVTTQPTNGTAGVTMSPVAITLLDQFGNATTATNSVSIALGTNPSSATLSGTSTRAAVNGVATFDDLKLDKAGTGFTLVATIGTIASATTSAFDMVSSGAATMQILDGPTLQPIPTTQAITVNATAGVVPANAPIVKITDLGGQPVAGAQVTFAGTGTGPSHTLNGTVTTNAQGEATFIGAINAADVYTVTVSASGLTGSPRTATINVSAAAAAKLVFKTPPSDVAVTASISPAIVVQVQDRFSNVVRGATNSITLTSTPLATLGGTYQVAALDSDATFSNISVPAAGSYTLTASSSGLTSATSPSFTVTGAVPTSIRLSDSTSLSVVAGAGIDASSVPIATLIDQAGHSIPNVTITLTVKSSNDTTVGTPRSFTTNSLGQVEFNSLEAADLPTTAGSYTIVPSSGGVVGSGVPLTITPAGAYHLSLVGASTFVGTQSSSLQSGLSTGLAVRVQDEYGNSVADGTVIDWSTGSYCATGITFPGTSPTSNGVAQPLAIAVAANAIGSCQLEASIHDSFVGARAGRPRPAANRVPRQKIRAPSRASMTLDPVARVEAYAIIAPSGANTWTGSVSTDYNTAANWQAGAVNAVPGLASQVYIPAAVQSPILSSDGLAGSIVLEDGNGNHLSLGTTQTPRTLTVSGSVDAGGSAITNGTLQLNSTSATTIKGTLPTTVVGKSTCGGGSFSLAGNATTGSVTVNCPLTIGGDTLTVSGNFQTATAGALIETTSGGLVDVSGTSTFAGASESGQLTAGAFKARGDFTQSNTVSNSSYAPTVDHRTLLSGASNQSVSFADTTNSFFNDVEVSNGGYTATFTSPAVVKRDFTITSTSGTAQATFNQPIHVVRNLTANANTKLTQTSGVGERVTVDGAVTANASADLGDIDSLVVTGSTFPIYNTTTASKAPKVTQLTGTVSMTGNGTIKGGLSVKTNLTVNGYTLNVDSLVVDGNLKLQSPATGPLNVVSVRDTVRINTPSGKIQADAGELDIGGNFVNNALSPTSSSFIPGSGFLTRFNGSGAQLVRISTPGASVSHFKKVEIANTGGGVTFMTSNPTIEDSLIVDGNAVLKSASGTSIQTQGAVVSSSGSSLSSVQELVVSGTSFPAFNGTNTPAKTTLAHAITMSADATLTGALDVQNLLSLSGHKLIVGGDFTVEGSGWLKVSNQSDSVVVAGNALFNGMSQSDFPFTNGAFEFRGNFTQSGSQTFFPGGNTQLSVRFTGSSAQTVSFADAVSSYFNNVYISNTTGVTFATDASLQGTLNLLTGAAMTVDTLTTLTLSSNANPAANFYSASNLHIHGTVGPTTLSCLFNDPGQSGGSSPTIDGGGTFGILPANVASTLSSTCQAGVLLP